MKAGCGLCSVLFGIMVWFAIFGFVVILPCSETRDVPGLSTCDCSDGFAHDFLPECVDECDCEVDRGCALCCRLTSTKCRIDPNIYLNSCGLDMHAKVSWYNVGDCGVSTAP